MLSGVGLGAPERTEAACQPAEKKQPH